jgi:hypothetical protein
MRLLANVVVLMLASGIIAAYVAIDGRSSANARELSAFEMKMVAKGATPKPEECRWSVQSRQCNESRACVRKTDAASCQKEITGDCCTNTTAITDFCSNKFKPLVFAHCHEDDDIEGCGKQFDQIDNCVWANDRCNCSAKVMKLRCLQLIAITRGSDCIKVP